MKVPIVLFDLIWYFWSTNRSTNYFGQFC